MHRAISYLLPIALAAASVSAQISPTAPGPGAIFRQGDECHFEWTGSPASRDWNNFHVDLMTGDNFNMIKLGNVVSNLDGTTPGPQSYRFPCPTVSPNSAIYFYQFSLAGDASPLWTTRFTIAAADGSTTPEPEKVQPDGKPIPWGKGTLVSGLTPASGQAGASAPAGASSATPAAASTSSPSVATPSVAASSSQASSDASTAAGDSVPGQAGAGQAIPSASIVRGSTAASNAPAAKPAGSSSSSPSSPAGAASNAPGSGSAAIASTNGAMAVKVGGASMLGMVGLVAAALAAF